MPTAYRSATTLSLLGALRTAIEPYVGGKDPAPLCEAYLAEME